MGKVKKIFECQSCGFQSPKWLGKCTNCGDWDSLIELNAERSTSSTIKATPITEIEKEDISRFSSGSEELDLVLGGGVVELALSSL